MLIDSESIMLKKDELKGELKSTIYFKPLGCLITCPSVSLIPVFLNPDRLKNQSSFPFAGQMVKMVEPLE